MSVKVCLHSRSVYTYLVRLRLRVCTHSARQMVRLHSHNVNLTDTVMETDTISVNRPLFTLAVAKPKSVLRSPLVLNTLTEVQEILAAFKGPFTR